MFKAMIDHLSFARAPDVMCTRSAIDFEWSVKLIGAGSFYVGIASRFKQEEHTWIYSYDKNSILYGTHYMDIRVGSNTVHSNLMAHKNGDVIRFRFQPRTKKLLIDLVRANIFSLPNLEIKNGHYEIDLQDNVNYFPVVQCISHNKGAEAHLIE